MRLPGIPVLATGPLRGPLWTAEREFSELADPQRLLARSGDRCRAQSSARAADSMFRIAMFPSWQAYSKSW
jgi:hypothetical protein